MDIDLTPVPEVDTGFVNELRPEFFGMQSLCATAMFDSSSRAQMHTSHFAQRVVLKKHDEKTLISGVEKKFSPYTFNVKMPENGRILKVIHKYDPRGDINVRGKQHTLTIVIYQNEETKEVSYFEIPYFMSNHQIFGFEYVPNRENMGKIRPGNYIPKGTIFADAPTVGERGSYDYGRRANVAFMSLKSVAEDGFQVSDRFMQSLGFKIREVRTFGVGKEQYLKNIYGKNADDIQPLPGLGEQVREDGLLAVSAKYDTELAPVEMSKFDLQEIDYIFDNKVYVKAGGARVIDITVIRNNEVIKKHPNEISGFLDKYADAYVEFNRKIYNTYLEIKADHKKNYGFAEGNISPSFHALVVEAMAICNIDLHKVKQPLKLLHRKHPIDEYHIEITVEHEIVPDVAGYKLSDLHGGNICPSI